MALKIEAAVNSRRNDDFLIIARTDAIAILGVEEAVRRGKLYEKAGADVVFLEAPRTLDELKLAAGSFNVPTMANLIEGGKTPFLSAAQLQDLGFKIAAYPHSLILTCIRAIQKTLATLMAPGGDGARTKATEPADSGYFRGELARKIAAWAQERGEPADPRADAPGGGGRRNSRGCRPAPSRGRARRGSRPR